MPVISISSDSINVLPKYPSGAVILLTPSISAIISCALEIIYGESAVPLPPPNAAFSSSVSALAISVAATQHKAAHKSNAKTIMTNFFISTVVFISVVKILYFYLRRLFANDVYYDALIVLISVTQREIDELQTVVDAHCQLRLAYIFKIFCAA